MKGMFSTVVVVSVTPCNLQDLSSPTRDQAQFSAMKAPSLNHDKAIPTEKLLRDSSKIDSKYCPVWWDWLLMSLMVFTYIFRTKSKSSFPR